MLHPFKALNNYYSLPRHELLSETEFFCGEEVPRQDALRDRRRQNGHPASPAR